MSILLRSLLVLLLAVGAAAPVSAQDAQNTLPSTPAPINADQLSSQLDQVKQALTDTDKLTDDTLAGLRGKVQGLQQQADQLGTNLAPQADALKAKLDVLGPAPEKGAPPEAPEVVAQRKQLNKAKADLDAQLKQAQTLSLESQQLINQIAGLRRDLFEAQISQRTSSPLSTPFWSSLSRALPDDTAGLKILGTDAQLALRQAWEPGNRAAFILCLLAALALLVLGRAQLERLLVRLTTDRMPAGHLRRSALAMLITLGTTLTYGVAVYLVYLGLNWNATLSQDMTAFGLGLVRLTAFSACLAGLGRALLSAGRPSWRMPALSDNLARRLRPFPWLLAWCTVLLGCAERITADIGASLATAVAINGLLSLLITGLVAAALLRMGRARRALLASGETPAKRPLWVGMLVAAAMLGVVLSLLGLLSGYIAFAFFVARQMLRGGFIVAALYLLMHLFNDLFTTVLSPHSRSGERLQEAFGIAPARLEQTAVLLSALSRTFLVLLALPLLLAPYGAGPMELLNRGGSLFAVRSIGTLPIVPENILSALLVLMAGMLALRLVKRWLNHELLPKTSLEAGLQTSIVTLLGYVGGVLVFVLVLGALKVDVQSIAWVASALSVGIGFGLQAIVQNFISGLILLAERPVKVGDWVSLSGVEGDIKRISVRATEIQQADRSTVIVPNSQLITQNVRNVTQAGALGRVQIRLPMPLGTDASKARKIILSALNAHASTLEAPSPSVLLDHLDGGSMNFLCTAYVGNPRDASTVKSDLLFELIDKLRAAGLPLSTPQDMIVRTMSAPPPEAPMPGKS
jgi:small-conductance mechanosensitive channel